MNRRDALRGLATAAGASLLAGASMAELVAVARKAREGMGQGAAASLLTARQAATVGTLAEIVLPRTDTPGATDAGVTAFIDTMLAGWMEPGERDRFLAGIEQLDADAVARFGTGFIDAAQEQRTELVALMDGEVAALLQADRESSRSAAGPQAPRHFFYRFKQLTLVGFFTSEVGATQALPYHPYPGRWDPCVPVEPEPRQ